MLPADFCVLSTCWGTSSRRSFSISSPNMGTVSKFKSAASGYDPRMNCRKTWQLLQLHKVLQGRKHSKWTLLPDKKLEKRSLGNRTGWGYDATTGTSARIVHMRRPGCAQSGVEFAGCKSNHSQHVQPFTGCCGWLNQATRLTSMHLTQ